MTVKELLDKIKDAKPYAHIEVDTLEGSFTVKDVSLHDFGKVVILETD